MGIVSIKRYAIIHSTMEGDQEIKRTRNVSIGTYLVLGTLALIFGPSLLLLDAGTSGGVGLPVLSYFVAP